MNELQKLLTGQVDWHIIAVTSVIIIGVALLAGFAWLFDKNELPEEKVDDENDFNHRTG
jgi:type IV secretory pathway VirB2 component (pilin)